jgi:hypothetical protein
MQRRCGLPLIWSWISWACDIAAVCRLKLVRTDRMEGCVFFFSVFSCSHTHPLLTSSLVMDHPWLLGSIYIDLLTNCLILVKIHLSEVWLVVFFFFHGGPHPTQTCQSLMHHLDRVWLIRFCFSTLEFYRYSDTWKEKHVSFGDRLILINSAVISCPTCMLSFFQTPNRAQLVGLLQISDKHKNKHLSKWNGVFFLLFDIRCFHWTQ